VNSLGLDARITLPLQRRDIWIGGWLYTHESALATTTPYVP
jgi:hypothetical protein